MSAACYSPPALPAGAPCATDDQCPLEQSCILGRCSNGDTPPPDGNSGACMTNDPQVADEDGDHLPDSCDPCPLLAGNAAADADQDGVPDACDPDLSASTTHKSDSIWLIEGFRSQPQWAVGAGITLGGDRSSLQIVAPGSEMDLERELVIPLARPDRTVFDDFRASLRFRISAAVGNAGPEMGFEILDEESTNSVSCMVVQDFGDASQRFLYMWDDGPLDVGDLFAWKENTDYTLDLERHGAIYTCRLSGGTSEPTPRVGSSTVVPRSGAAVRIMAFGVTAAVNWVYVAGSP